MRKYDKNSHAEIEVKYSIQSADSEDKNKQTQL